MNIIIVNRPETGVTITRVYIPENQTVNNAPIAPGVSVNVNLPNLDSCQIGVEYVLNGLTEHKQRIAPVTEDSNTITLMLPPGSKELYLN